MVFNGRDNNVLSFFLSCQGNSFNGKIIGFCPRGSKNNFLVFSPDQTGDAGSRLVDSRLASEPISYTLEGLANRSLKYGSMASITSFLTEVADA